MKRRALPFFAILLIAVSGQVQAEIGGYVQTDNHLFLQKNDVFTWSENRLALKIEASPAPAAHVYSEFWLRTSGFPGVTSLADLSSMEKDRLIPGSILFREAYIDLYGFLLPGLDLRIGLQRIAWGTADGLNPTDNLNPDDLEAIWDFGRHLSSNAFKASYYLGGFTITAVYIPIFTPAALPAGPWAGAFSAPVGLPDGFTPGTLKQTVRLPGNNIKENSIAGFKGTTNILGLDFSLSYIYGRDDIPLAENIIFAPGTAPGAVDVDMELVYPRIQVLGLDMAGALGSIGIWAEGALFFPEKVNTTVDSTRLGGEIQELPAMDYPYYRYVAGADYTFKSGWYINAQYMHGFIQERRAEDMGDYFFLKAEWTLLNGKLKIAPLNGGGEIRDFTDIKNNYALVFGSGITYYPADNAEIILGLTLLEGSGASSFGSLKDNDELYLRVKYTF